MEEQKPKINLVSVSEVPGATALNRIVLRRLEQQQHVSVDINVKVVPDLDGSMISLVVSCTYIAQIGVLRYRVLTSSVIATFEVENLREHVVVSGEDVVVDDHIMLTMLSISVGALRGVVAVRTAGTALRHRPLPVIDLRALLYRLHYGRKK
ncbi:MAG: hypothetical protein K2M55_07010 [Muribaculaceae bacterium]|nr:hypothetical protein [Muribaculaceae bacterium]